jgi:hypothetical protein
MLYIENTCYAIHREHMLYIENTFCTSAYRGKGDVESSDDGNAPADSKSLWRIVGLFYMNSMSLLLVFKQTFLKPLNDRL